MTAGRAIFFSAKFGVEYLKINATKQIPQCICNGSVKYKKQELAFFAAILKTNGGVGPCGTKSVFSVLKIYMVIHLNVVIHISLPPLMKSYMYWPPLSGTIQFARGGGCSIF